MPCYLFTYHGHATWMPDHRRGYVHRSRGIQSTDPHMAAAYRRNQREGVVLFAAVQQDLLIEAVLGTGAPLDATIHAIATEPTHIHVLVSWAHSRTFRSMRASIRGAMTRVLNERFGKRTWFSDSPSRKRVLDHEHFDHLILEYLPSHRGVTWTCARDVAAAERRDAQRTVSVHERTRHPDQND